MKYLRIVKFVIVKFVMMKTPQPQKESEPTFLETKHDLSIAQGSIWPRETSEIVN